MSRTTEDVRIVNCTLDAEDDALCLHVVSKLGGTLFLTHDQQGGVLHHENLPEWLKKNHPNLRTLVLCYREYWFDPAVSQRVIRSLLPTGVRVAACETHSIH